MADNNWQLDSKEFYTLKTQVNEVHAYLFGSADIRYDQAGRKPLFYMMPDIEETLRTIARELEEARRGRFIRDIATGIALALGVVGIVTAVYALSVALRISGG